MNQNESDLTKIQTLIHGQESKLILVNKQEYVELKRDVKEMRANIADIKGARTMPTTPAATPTCSKIFPRSTLRQLRTTIGTTVIIFFSQYATTH